MLKRMLLFALSLALVGVAGPAAAQQRQVTGQVVHAGNGSPLGDAQVTIAGTARGTTTDPQGSFTLSVPSGPVRLRVSRIGFVPQEISLAPSVAEVTVRLAEDVLNLEGLVVTGQATTIARRNLANAVATVSADELNQVPAQTVEKALQGKVAGAKISTNSGAPGGGVQVDLRGVSSINASSEPLWVIDGVVISNVAVASGANAVTRASGGSNASNQDAPVNRIADINPEDIESIEILKGASAAAIYGSRASNGVIIVTTKSGRRGAPELNLRQRVGYYELSNTLGARSWTRSEAVDAFGLDAATADRFFAGEQPRQQFDLERQIAGRRAPATETSLSIRGGNEATRYFVSGLLLNEDGIIENTGYDKQSVRLNLDQRLGSRVDVGINSNLIHSVARRGLTNNDNTGTSFYMVLPFTPNFVDLRRNADGSFPVNPFERSNPLETIALMDNDENVWRFLSAVNVRADVFSSDAQSLRLTVNGGADYFNQLNTLFFPPELQFEDDDQQPGTSLRSSADNLYLTGNSSLVHTFSPLSGAFTATTSAGVQYSDQDLSTVRIVGRGLVAGQRNVDAATSSELFQNRNRVRTLGLYGQEEFLALDNRLLVTLGIRADRSSANGDPDKFFMYPKSSASFRLPEFGGFMDELKLRAAYGESGNQPLFGQKFTQLSATNNIAGLPGFVLVGSAGDPDIRPERTREIEGGFDATFFGGNAQLSVTGYHQNITDLLLQRTVAPSTGFTVQTFNGGELRVRGLEAALAATPIRTDRFSWYSNTTFYTDKSEITSLPVPSFRTGGFGTALGAFQIEEGRSATQIVANVLEDGQVVVRPVGDANPDFKVGFTNRLTFGPLELYGLVDWQKGGRAINLTRLLFDFGQNTPDFTTEGIKRISAFGSETRPYIEDASFVKVRELSLTYDVPVGMFSGVVAARSASLSVSGRNLFTFTDYTGLDPEVSNFGNQQIARNIDVAPFPPSRSFWLSVNLGF